MHRPPFRKTHRLSDWPECVIELHCLRCRSGSVGYPVRLLIKRKGDMTFENFLGRLRCKRCHGVKPAPVYLVAGLARSGDAEATKTVSRQEERLRRPIADADDDHPARIRSALQEPGNISAIRNIRFGGIDQAAVRVLVSSSRERRCRVQIGSPAANRSETERSATIAVLFMHRRRQPLYLTYLISLPITDWYVACGLNIGCRTDPRAGQGRAPKNKQH
jgi:hypothetical protein